MPTDFVEHDLGPALIFRYDPKLIRLDRFLSQSGQDSCAQALRHLNTMGKASRIREVK